jgi:hypothetical protein
MNKGDVGMARCDPALLGSLAELKEDRPGKKKVRKTRSTLTSPPLPARPQHILPGGEAKLSRLPTFIDEDFEKKISEVEGTLEIKCQDVFGKSHITRQKFWMKTNYKADKPSVHIIFWEVLLESNG